MRIRRGLSLSLSLVLSGAVAGCYSPLPSVNTSRLSPLQVRAMETRTYDGPDTKTALKTVLNVLQDEGFLVDYGNTDLGLLHASKTIGATTDQAYTLAVGVFDGLNGNRSFGSMAMIEATANVSDFGNQIKVRINFQRKLVGLNGVVLAAAPIGDPRTYQEFFAKLDRGLFIQNQGL